MSVITRSQFMEIYGRRPETTVEDAAMVSTHAIETFHAFSQEALAKNLLVEDHMSELPNHKLEALFWGMQVCECCVRHMSCAPVAIDTDEETPAAPDAERTCQCYCRMGRRFLRRAYLKSGSRLEE